jgi:hypothetical protein
MQLVPMLQQKIQQQIGIPRSSFAPEAYSAFRMLAAIVDGTGNKCRHSYLVSMYTRAPFTCSTAMAIGRSPNR